MKNVSSNEHLGSEQCNLSNLYVYTSFYSNNLLSFKKNMQQNLLCLKRNLCFCQTEFAGFWIGKSLALDFSSAIWVELPDWCQIKYSLSLKQLQINLWFSSAFMNQVSLYNSTWTSYWNCLSSESWMIWLWRWINWVLPAKPSWLVLIMNSFSKRLC